MKRIMMKIMMKNALSLFIPFLSSDDNEITIDVTKTGINRTWYEENKILMKNQKSLSFDVILDDEE